MTLANMTLANRLHRSLGIMVVGVTVFSASLAMAQEEPSEAHREAARGAIDALGATDQFDQILPEAAERLKSTLIRATPNYQEAIIETVDETAIDLASRRADLEREAATIYAQTFTQEELEAITAFYTSEAGIKLLENGTEVTRQLLQAAQIWANGIQRDLATETDTALEAKLGGEAPSAADAGIDPETGVAEGEEPAELAPAE
jgi:hypothetical protein